MTTRDDRWRLVLGAVLLSVSVLAPLGRRLGELLLVFGGALLAGARAGAQRPRRASPDGTRLRISRAPRLRTPRLLTLFAVAASVLAAVLVADRTVLRHGRVTASERTVASRNPTVAGGRAAGAERAGDLHQVAVGEPFSLLGARVRVGAVTLCRRDQRTVASVPISLSPETDRGVMGTPSFQLLDASGRPSDPSAVLSPDRRLGSAKHAAPPPRVFHELAEFGISGLASTKPLRLDVQSATGNGSVYRVRFAVPAISDIQGAAGSGTCAQPGGAP